MVGGVMRSYDLVVLGEVTMDVILAGVDKVPKSWSILGRTKAAGIFTAGSAGYVAQCYSKLGATSPSTTRS
jgi:sugar/nucleoside kinase (ribokinase family)